MSAMDAVPSDHIEGPEWSCVDFISDIHLGPTSKSLALSLKNHLSNTPAQAVFILGDLLEVWIGDDCLEQAHFEIERDCVHALKQASLKRSIFFMPGNRDFLVGTRFLQESGMCQLRDPCVLQTQGQRILLSHGDELCTGDLDYQVFRQEVRSQAWRTHFLALPLEQRLSMAKKMRAQSQIKQSHQDPLAYAELDTQACLDWLEQSNCELLIHGHTHRPMRHALSKARAREVLSDWDADAIPPRRQVLRLQDGLLKRLEVF